MLENIEVKHTYLHAMHLFNGSLDELELGEKLGFSYDETMKIISQLLNEFKIEYIVHKHCNYRIIKPKTKRI